MYPLMAEGMPNVWMTHVSVADIEATSAAVKEAGGQVIVEPMALPHGIGKLAVFLDSTGAVFGLWEPRSSFAGAELVNEPGALLLERARDPRPRDVEAFYGAVFGWAFEDHEMGEMGTYTEWKLGGASIGGMANISGRVPDEIPAHWMVYFTVDDADATVAKIGEFGGSVHFGPLDVLGRPLRDGCRRCRGRLRGDRAAGEQLTRASRLPSGRRSRPRPPIRRVGRGWRS